MRGHATDIRLPYSAKNRDDELNLAVSPIKNSFLLQQNRLSMSTIVLWLPSISRQSRPLRGSPHPVADRTTSNLLKLAWGRPIHYNL